MKFIVGIARASRRAVALLGLGTTSPSRLLARYGSGVRFQHESASRRFLSHSIFYLASLDEMCG
jgi:hypothetical protein